MTTVFMTKQLLVRSDDLEKPSSRSLKWNSYQHHLTKRKDSSKHHLEDWIQRIQVVQPAMVLTLVIITSVRNADTVRR
jgi:hypothetical protein